MEKEPRRLSGLAVGLIFFGIFFVLLFFAGLGSISQESNTSQGRSDEDKAQDAERLKEHGQIYTCLIHYRDVRLLSRGAS